MPNVFTQRNFNLSAAPPTYYIPDENGFPVPAGLTSWRLSVDLGGTIPVGESCVIWTEYLLGTTWVPHAAMNWITGPFQASDGTQTTIHSVQARLQRLNMPYPTAARFRVDQAGNWRIPSIALDLT
jgi:hypothetical protein